MIKISFLILMTIGFLKVVQAQDDASHHAYRYQHYIDFSAALGQKEFSGALSWTHLHGVGKKDQAFKLGYGLRFTSYTGANKYYTTAPSRYTSPVQNLGTIFSETYAENIDTIAIQTGQVNFLNLTFNLQYTIKNKLDLGCNIDVTGFSFGTKKKANVISGVYDPGQAPVQYARPSSFNLLLTSDNDIGSLNSEFFARYWISDRIAVRAGYAFIFTEYRTSENLSFDQGRIVNDRYRLKSSMFMVSVSFRPFVK